MSRKGFKRPVTAELPASTFGPPACPTCGTPCGEDTGAKPWMVTITNEGVELRAKGSRRERFVIDWHLIRDAAIRRGFATGKLIASPGKPRGRRRTIRVEELAS